jgi:hypothetical protein
MLLSCLVLLTVIFVGLRSFAHSPELVKFCQEIFQALVAEMRRFIVAKTALDNKWFEFVTLVAIVVAAKSGAACDFNSFAHIW